MRIAKEFILIEKSKEAIDVYEIDGLHFYLDKTLRHESMKKPMLDDKNQQINHKCDDDNLVPVFYFEKVLMCYPFMVQIELDDDQLKLFAENSKSIESIEKVLEPYEVKE